MSGQGYAVGENAWGICGRSGKRMLLKDMVEDGDIPGLLVSPEWYEPEHPQERPVEAYDAQALRRTAPDTDKVGHTTRVGREYDITNDRIEKEPYAIATMGRIGYTVS